jgi:hypothetical protein
MVKEYRYYTYKVTFKDLPKYFYYGRKKDCGKPYLGSPKTFRHLWDFFEPEVQILCWYKTAKEAQEAEDALIGHTWKQVWNGRRYSLNRNKGGLIDEEVCSENGKKNAENLNSHPNTTRSKRKHGKARAEKMNRHPNTIEGRKKNVGKIPKEILSKNGRENGRENGKKCSKKVFCIETGEVYSSVREAERQTGASSGGIIRSAQSGGRTSSGGLHWGYLPLRMGA